MECLIAYNETVPPVLNPKRTLQTGGPVRANFERVSTWIYDCLALPIIVLICGRGVSVTKYSQTHPHKMMMLLVIVYVSISIPATSR